MADAEAPAADGPLHLLFSYRGRIGIGKYWAGIGLAFTCLVLGFGLLASAMNPTGGGADAFLGLPLLVLFIWIDSAVTIKRVRDAGRTIVLGLIFAFGPLAWLAATAEFIEQAWFVILLGLAGLVVTPGILPSRPRKQQTEQMASS
jgi:uncharacterized membrane protein YhaH (DUF805 family)